MIRRAIGLFLVVSFSLFTLEVAVADVHDGDASPTELAKAPGGAQGSPASPDSPLQGATHDVHVCHCVHAHGTLSSRAIVLAAAIPASAVRLTLEVIAPVAVDLDVQLRPPIA